MKILLVEDNEAIILGLEYLLKEEGYTFYAAKSGMEARNIVKKDSPDLILLDVSLPDEDGFNLCREWKSETTIPIIFLTAKEEERDVVKGFELGADDYVIKPFRNRELISRIKSQLRKSGKTNEVLNCGELSLNTRTGKVLNGNEEIILTKLEYKILSNLMNNQGKLFTREEILEGIWDVSGNFVNDNTLSVTMKRLRDKIGDKEGNKIRTVRGIGYRMEKPHA